MATPSGEDKIATKETEAKKTHRGDIPQEETKEAIPNNEEKPPQAKEEEKPKLLPVRPRSFLRELLSETVLGFIFWSIFQELLPTIWFPILGQQQFTGYEKLCLVWLLPQLCSVAAIHDAFASRWGILVLRVVCVAGIGSFQATDHVTRILMLALGNGAGMLLLCGTLWHKSLHQRSVSFWGLVLGYFAVLASRIWFISLNPAWSSTQSNSVVIALGIIAAVDRFVSAEYPEPQAEPDPAMAASWRRTAMGFGSLLFLTQWIFGEVSILCRWTVTGAPHTGPHPFPGGAAIFVELLTGILMSSKKELPTHFLWSWFIGVHCFIGLYYLQSYLGLFCGLLLGMYVTSIWPEMVDRLTSCPPAKTLTLAMAIYLLEMHFAIWTTAFEFLPVGGFTREQTLILGAFVMFNIIRALLMGKSRDHEDPVSKHTAFPNLDGTGTYQIFADAKIYLVLLLIIGCSGFLVRFPSSKHQLVAKTDPREFTSLVWNAHFMHDEHGLPNYETSAKMLNDSGADVIALFDTDTSKPYLGQNDISMWLGARLRMYDDFGPATKLHTWGCAFFSKYPIVSSEHHLLPSLNGRVAPAVRATVNISGSLVDFVAARMGHAQNDPDKRQQAEALSNITRRSKNPTVLLVDASMNPGSKYYKKFTTFGRLQDIDTTDLDRHHEYIFYKRLIRKAYGRISDSDISNTDAQMARFLIPKTRDYKDNNAVTLDWTDVDESDRLPNVFVSHPGAGAEANTFHYYKGTPKYFLYSEETPKPKKSKPTS